MDANEKQKILAIAQKLKGDAAPDPYDDRDTDPSWLQDQMIKAARKLEEIANGR